MKSVRHKRIINLIKINGIVRVTSLAKQLNVTPETIRSDLNELARKKIIIRCHGGAYMELESLDKAAKKEIIHYMETENIINKEKSKGSGMISKVCVMGSFNVDMISYLPRLPEAGESLLATKFMFSPGGKGCNQALAASSADSQVHFITKIGCDQFSEFAVNFISSSKIATSAIYRSEDQQTGTALIFVDEPYYDFSSFLKDKKVSADLQWGLRYDPYCCCDNMARKDIDDVIYEVNYFIEPGGRTIVDATGSQAIGRDVNALAEVAERTGLNIVAASGLYLEKFEGVALSKNIETLASNIDKELNEGIGETTIRAGMIGEIGVSPFFTENEKNNLRAAALAQTNNPHISMNIHMPGWQRRGDEVLHIVLHEFSVNPQKVSLAHSDPSGKDIDYQRRLLDLGIWLEFDMIGLDISFPKEGVAPGVMDTADAVCKLIDLGYASQLVLSHDVFLKQMWAKNGGNGWGFVPNVFLSLLTARGVDKKIIEQLCIHNPANLLA